MKIINIFLLLLSADLATACSCGDFLIDLPVKEMGWTQSETAGISGMADLVFTGILLDAQPVEETCQIYPFNEIKETKYELIFKLIKSYKGEKRDTIKIRTNYGSSACGFQAQKNTACLIFAGERQNGYFYTYRSDCCRSISKQEDEKRYNKYVSFLESLMNMIDGAYIFYQSKGYWRGGSPDNSDTLEVMRYSIKNGKLEGNWQIKDREGRVLERGVYKNGQKIGTWEVTSYTKSDLKDAEEQVKFEKITYRKGKPKKCITLVEDRALVWAEPFHIQILRKQKIIRKYKYFKVEK
jgi:hypothetical protein